MVCMLYNSDKRVELDPLLPLDFEIKFLQCVSKIVKSLNLRKHNFKYNPLSEITPNEFLVIDTRYIKHIWISGKKEDYVFYLSYSQTVNQDVANLIAYRMKRPVTFYSMYDINYGLNKSFIGDKIDVPNIRVGKWCDKCNSQSYCEKKTPDKYIEDHQILSDYIKKIESNNFNYEKLLSDSVKVSRFIDRLTEDFFLRLGRREKFNNLSSSVIESLSYSVWDTKADTVLRTHEHKFDLFVNDRLISVNSARKYLTDEELDNLTVDKFNLHRKKVKKVK